METVHDLPPREDAPELRAIFSPFRAGALAGVSGNRIGQWARYGLIQPSYFEGRPANLYAFYDVAEAIVVHWLLKRSFKYREIHLVIDRAREEQHPKWPLQRSNLAVAQTAVEDRGTIAMPGEEESWIDLVGRRGDQTIVRPELLEEARLVLRRGGWLADQLHLSRLEVDPDKLGGAPSLRGRRWPVERVAQIAADEEGRQILVEDYQLDPRDVSESLTWVEAAAAL